MACLSSQDIINLTKAGCNSIQAVIEAFLALNENACGECTGTVPASTDPADFLTDAVDSNNQPIFQPPSPNCERLYVLEEDYNRWYVSYDGGTTWRIDTSCICCNPFEIPEGTDPDDFINIGWDGVVPFQSVCPVLLAIVGCAIYMIVNGVDECDPITGDSWTKVTQPEGLSVISVEYDSTTLIFDDTTELDVLNRYYFNNNVKDLNTPPTTANSITLPIGNWLCEYHLTYERADDDLAELDVVVNIRRDTSGGAVLHSRSFFTSGVSDSVTPNYYGLPITLQGYFVFSNVADDDIVFCVSTGNQTKNSTCHSATMNIKPYLV